MDRAAEGAAYMQCAKKLARIEQMLGSTVVEGTVFNFIRDARYAMEREGDAHAQMMAEIRKTRRTIVTTVIIGFAAYAAGVAIIMHSIHL